jgi:hypothetical protein
MNSHLPIRSSQQVRTSDQFYLLASKSFQDMNDWVNCLRLVAFGQQQPTTTPTTTVAAAGGQQASGASNGQQLAASERAQSRAGQTPGGETLGSTSSGASSSASTSSASTNATAKALAAAAAQKRQNQCTSTNNNNTVADVLLNRPQQAASSTHEYSKQPHVSSAFNTASAGGLVSATSRLAASAPDHHLATNGCRPVQLGAASQQEQQQKSHLLTASQAAAVAASALAKTRQRQPSLLGSCKPQPPIDSPFIQQQQHLPSLTDNKFQTMAGPNEGRTESSFGAAAQMDTLTPTVRGQLIAAATTLVSNQSITSQPFAAPTANGGGGPLPQGQLADQQRQQQATFAGVQNRSATALSLGKQIQIGSALDEEEENMLYCSIEDNPSEHNYRVKVIETELALRCQLKCYQLTAPTTISQQYEELAQFRSSSGAPRTTAATVNQLALENGATNMVTFYQLIIGPQELTLLNDYATSYHQSSMMANNKSLNSKLHHQQGLWSWPYQCIRRYGFDKDNCFMFEAGRKCTSGPGQFIVQTPKAYNIYQDVVKFVNELRTISATNQPTAMTQAQTNESMQLRQQQLQQQPKQMIVTQIPVTWAPSNSDNNNSIAGTNNPEQQQQPPQSSDVSSRRQFFDALRQLDYPIKPTGGAAPAKSGHLIGGDHQHSTSKGCSNDNNNGLVVGGQYAAAHHNSRAGDELASLNTIDGHRATAQMANKADAHQAIAKLTSHDFGIATQIEGAQSPKSDRPQQPRETVQGATIERCTTAVTSSKITANNNQNQQQQSASISSSGSDETDESGYEQGDESVDSGPVLMQQSSNGARTRQQQHTTTVSHGGAAAAAGSRRNPSNNTASSRLANSDHSSSAMSSSASSASNSPGQSMSRRTADLSGHSAPLNGDGQQIKTGHPNHQRPRLPLPNELTKSTSAISNVVASRPMAGANQKLQTGINAARSTSGLHNLLTNSLLGDGIATSVRAKGVHAKSASNIKTIEDDFETSLIRDVYSEITKLHAKFAVTTNGADDSISSGGESVVASSSSDNNACANGDEDEGSHDDDDDDDDDDDYDSMDGRDADGQNNSEPMYSNLKPAGHCAGRTASAAAAGQRTTTNGGSQPTSPQKPPLPPKQQLHGGTHLNPIHFHEHMRPPPLYPTMLNPIPEIAENHAGRDDDRANTNRNRLSLLNGANSGKNNSNVPSDNNPHRQRQHTNDADADPDQTRPDGLPRARLALNREAIKKSQQSVGQQQQQQLCSSSASANKRPTNHYLINDVQYAKISRNMTSGSRIQCQDQRRR